VRPFQLEAIIDALEASEISNLTVVGGGERPTEDAIGVYRGGKYKIRFVQASIIDVTAPDDQVDGIVQTVINVCNAGPEPSAGRILVTPVDEWYTVRPRQQRIA
jgi:nitrogen regulatory protein PII